MKRKRNILTTFVMVLLLYVLGSSALHAQYTITGNVTSLVEGNALSDVVVLIEGTTFATVTDMDGNYSLSVLGTDVLIFSLSGYKSQTIAVADQTVLNVALSYDWGIIGTATTTGDDWAEDIDLLYVGEVGNAYTWRGVFPLKESVDATVAFKFRINGWLLVIEPGNATVTNLTDGKIVVSNTNWRVVSGNEGFYYFEVSTNDAGTTWNLIMDEANWGVYNGTADSLLTYNNDLSSLTGLVHLNASSGYRFRTNSSDDFNLAGDLLNLDYNSANLNVGDDEVYRVTLQSIDAGLTYSASLESTLVAHYPFSGDATDASSNGNDGTPANGETYTTDRFGNNNAAYIFDGVDDRINIGNDLSLKPDFPISFSAWIDPELSYNGGVIWGNDDLNSTGTYNGLRLGFEDDGRVIIGIYGGPSGPGGRKVFYTDASIELNIWTHIIGIWKDANTLEIYFNKVLQSGTWDDGTVTGITYTTAEAHLGYGLSSTDVACIGGKLDDVRIYNRQLSQSDIDTLFTEGGWSSLNSGLIAYYPFSGDATDASGYGNDGTENGGVALTTDRFGNANSAYSFDGVDDYIKIDNIDFAGGTDQVTLSWWVRANNTSESQYNYMSYFGSISAGYSEGLGKFGMNINSSTTILTVPIEDGNWQHYAFTYNGVVEQIYRNGLLSTEFNNAGNIIENQFNTIGADRQASSSFLNGHLDDMRVYNRALSATEIANLYHTNAWDINNINSFSLVEQTNTAVIDTTVHTVNIEVAYGTDVTALVPSFSLSQGATVTVGTTIQVSSTTANDFTNPVTYTVTAEDGVTTQDWTITVTTNPYQPIIQFSLEIDITTAVASGQSFSVAAQDVNPYGGVKFNKDGTKMYILGFAGGSVYEYNLSTPYDLTSAGYSQSFPVASEDGNVQDMDFNYDGTKMYMLGSSLNNIYEYNLSSAFDVSTASVNTSFSIAAQDIQPRAITFKTDGHKLYLLGNENNEVYEYHLSKAFDITTATFQGNFSIALQEGNPRDIAVSANGSSMYILGDLGNDINEYGLSQYGDVTTASWKASFPLTGQDFPYGFDFSKDGTKLFVVEDGAVDSVIEYLFSDIAFNEELADDGSVNGSLLVTIENAEFADAGGVLTSPEHFTIPNIPAGLTPILNVNGSFARLNLTGTSTAHTSAENILDIQFSFTDAAFLGTTKDNVINSDGPASSNFGIKFLANTETDILSFTIPEQVGITTVDDVNHTVTLEVLANADLSSLKPIISLSYGASINPLTGAANDFSASPAPYTVTAEDGTTNQTWEVTVNVNTSFETGTVSDIDGNVYPTVKIGYQWWMAENLRTTNYSDGTVLVDGTTAGVIDADYTTKYRFSIDDNPANDATYGSLYTWAAAMNGTSTSMGQGACPTGWHVPSDLEWKEMEIYLGMSLADADATGDRGDQEGGMLKEVGLTSWNYPNTSANNSVGFRALPAGQRDSDGTYNSFGDEAGFWLSDLTSSSQAWARHFRSTSEEIGRGAPELDLGFSVRCIEDRSSENDITSLGHPELLSGSLDIDEINYTVTAVVDYGTDLTTLDPTISISDFASIDPGSGSAQDFTSSVVYTVTAEDRSTQDWSINITLEEDITAPGFALLTLPTLYQSGEAQITAVANVTDDLDLTLVTFNYKLLTEAVFTTQLLTSTSDDFTFGLTENMVSDVGLEYFFYAEDQTGNTASSDTVQIIIQYSGTNGPSIPNLGSGGRAQDWRMFSIPFEMDNKSVGTIFESPLGTYDPSKWRIFHYKNDTDGFVEYKKGLSIVERGKGYWFNSVKSATIPMSPGKSPGNTKNRPATLNLVAGWNQIGNPYTFDVAWSDVMDYNNIINNEVENNLRITNNGTSLSNSTILKAFGGAYLMANQAIILEVPLIANSGGRIQDSNGFNEGWLLNISLVAGIFSNTVSGLGMHPNAIFSNDRYDQIKAPRFEKFIDASFNHPEYFMPEFSRDIVPELDNYVWEFSVTSNVELSNRIISWNRPDIPEHNTLTLIDLENDNLIDMQSEISYSYAGDDSRKFKVVYGDLEYLIEQLGEDKFHLGNNYPNPLTNGTTIPFSVYGSDDEYKVCIKIYSINGQLIKDLMNSTISSGIYSVEWDAKDDAGNQQLGMFIYSLEVTTDEGVKSFRKKMIVQ